MIKASLNIMNTIQERMLWKWLDKKIKNQPEPVKRFQYRAMNTAMEILARVQRVPFEELSFSLYFFCNNNDLKSRQLARLYESQIELAGANPERFVKGLYHFYNETSIKIKKENLYDQFFDFAAACCRRRTQQMKKGTNQEIILAYQMLVLQNKDYLRPQKFNFNNTVCGIKTTGDIMTIPDHFPDLDVVDYEYRKLIREGKIKDEESSQDILQKMYDQHNYKFPSKDVKRINNSDRVFTEQIAVMLPFINEYTFDILPQTIFIASIYFIKAFNVDIDENILVEKLQHRRKTLPSNGVLFKINSSIISSVLMKEIYYDDTIFMLYRMNTECGDISGYYNTKTGYMYSVLLDARSEYALVLHYRLKKLLLYLYTSIVADDTSKMLSDLQKVCSHNKTVINNETNEEDPIIATAYMKGGKLNNIYDNVDSDLDNKQSTNIRKNNESYSYKDCYIQGFIRRLPLGHCPSEQARELGKSLGYDLAPNETYVQPFIKRVLFLKELSDD